MWSLSEYFGNQTVERVMKCVSERMVLAQEQVAISEVGINSGQLLEKESIRGGSSRSCFQSESSGQKPNCSREAPFLGKGNMDSV